MCKVPVGGGGKTETQLRAVPAEWRLRNLTRELVLRHVDSWLCKCGTICHLRAASKESQNDSHDAVTSQSVPDSNLTERRRGKPIEKKHVVREEMYHLLTEAQRQQELYLAWACEPPRARMPFANLKPSCAGQV